MLPGDKFASRATAVEPPPRLGQGPPVSEALDHRSEPSALWWHAAFALAVIALGVLLLLTGEVGGRPSLALAGLALPGIAGLALRSGGHVVVRLLPFVWAIGVTIAAVLTGGLTGPFAVMTLMPALAAIALRNGGVGEGAILSIAAVALTGLAQAAGLSAPDQPLPALWLALFALAVVALWGAAAIRPALQRRGEDKATGTEVRQLRAALSAARARIQAVETEAADAHAADRAKSAFLANMSHELRTPLNAVLGFSDTMRMRMFGPLPDRYASYAELIHESGRHLLDLINDLLDISKIEADRYVLERETFDVGEAASAALRLMRLQAHDAGVALSSELPVRPLEVDADRRAVKQIVINLLSNALKFTTSGGSATLTVREAAGQLEIVASDTGVGIAPEDLERLGRPYEQAGDAASRARGTGPGLSLVRALAALHGGAVGIESRLGEGTAVTVRLPVLIAAPVEALPDMSPDGVRPAESIEPAAETG